MLLLRTIRDSEGVRLSLMTRTGGGHRLLFPLLGIMRTPRLGFPRRDRCTLHVFMCRGVDGFRSHWKGNRACLGRTSGENVWGRERERWTREQLESAGRQVQPTTQRRVFSSKIIKQERWYISQTWWDEEERVRMPPEGELRKRRLSDVTARRGRRRKTGEPEGRNRVN